MFLIDSDCENGQSAQPLRPLYLFATLACITRNVQQKWKIGAVKPQSSLGESDPGTGVEKSGIFSFSQETPNMGHLELKTEQMTLTLLCTSYIFHTICSALCTIITVFSFD